MIHLDQGGRYNCIMPWFDSMFNAGMLPIDAIRPFLLFVLAWYIHGFEGYYEQAHKII